MESGIYSITNTINGKFYLGSCQLFNKRKREHFAFLKLGTHPNAHLQSAWNKYGEPAFEFNKWAEVSVDRVLEAEQHLLDRYWGTEQCYNISKDAVSPCRGRKFGSRSEETKRKIGLVHKGKILSKDTREKISNSLKRFYSNPDYINPVIGMHRTEEQKERMRKPKANTLKMGLWQVGRKFSEAHKQNIGNALRGKKYNCNRVGENNNNVKLTKETVMEIRKLYSSGGYTHKMLAEKYGVKSRNTIGNIVSHRSWNNI